MSITKQNIYFFYGQDSFSAHEKLSHWRQEFEKKYGDLNFQIFDGENLTASNISEAFSTVPFLSEKKLIIVKDFLSDGGTEEQKKTGTLLESIPDYCLLVFIENKEPDARTTLFKTLTKLATVVKFPLLSPEQLVDWIQKRTSQKKGIIGKKEASYLAQKVGPDLWQLSLEIEKLNLYSGGRPFAEAMIDSLIVENISTSIFALTDAIAQKNSKKTLEILQRLIQGGEDLMQILYMIARHIRILIHISACLKEGFNQSEITAKLKEHPFTIQNGIKQSKNFDIPQLKKIYESLLSIDIKLKTGKIRISTEDQTELRLALEKSIAQSSL